MKRPSNVFLIFCLLGFCAIVLQHIFLHFGPNDEGAGHFTYNIVGQKYGFPPPHAYVGNRPPPTTKLWWQVVAYKEDPDKKGGVYTVNFQHMIQDGPSISEVHGQLICYYDAYQNAFKVLDMQVLP